MVFQTLKSFDKPALVEVRDNDQLRISERILILMIKAFEKPILWAAWIALKIRWSDFQETQQADPFSRCSRVRIHLDEHHSALGHWGFSLGWDPDHDDYGGMEIEYTYFLVFPISCEPVF
ncbi:MAG: hypothetical protein KF712_16365 [Akkermansiaceae bacterium]|nr:hypothetical protein [Akkermansiaceae bacterium]